MVVLDHHLCHASQRAGCDQVVDDGPFGALDIDLEKIDLSIDERG
jgi:hypothetical protein